MISDEAWYRQYLGGDEKAAEELVQKYGDALTLYLNGYIKDMQEAEDLMIEAFARMFAKERPVQGEGSFRAYLYKTARSLALRHLQKRRFRLLTKEELLFEPAADEGADGELFLKERNRLLYEALAELKAEYREALYLIYFEDMSYREAAAVMKKNEQQITNLVYRGRQSLKTALQKKGFHYEDK